MQEQINPVGYYTRRLLELEGALARIRAGNEQLQADILRWRRRSQALRELNAQRLHLTRTSDASQRKHARSQDEADS